MKIIAFTDQEVDILSSCLSEIHGEYNGGGVIMLFGEPFPEPAFQTIGKKLENTQPHNHLLTFDQYKEMMSKGPGVMENYYPDYVDYLSNNLTSFLLSPTLVNFRENKGGQLSVNALLQALNNLQSHIIDEQNDKSYE